jgi:hypothetical protein
MGDPVLDEEAEPDEEIVDEEVDLGMKVEVEEGIVVVVGPVVPVEEVAEEVIRGVEMERVESLVSSPIPPAATDEL